MLTLLLILASKEAAGGVGLGTGAAGLFGWLVKRHFRKRDERRKAVEEREAARDRKIDSLVECTTKTATGFAVLQTKVEEGFKAGDQRMQRIEAAQDNTSRDIRQIRADVTTIKRKTGSTAKHEGEES